MEHAVVERKTVGQVIEMPLYEYRCEKCGTVTEVLAQRGAAAPTCPKCGAKKLTRERSTFAIGTSSKPESFCEKHPEHCATCPGRQEAACPLPE